MTDASDWIPAGGLQLEPNALLAATEADRHVLVVAGPGAGKTELLAQRADFLLRTGLCPYPRRILAISFKTDAAENLRLRVAERCGIDLAHRLDSHTFHGFAKRLIDNYRVALTGIDALDHDYEVGPQRIERRQITFDDMVPLATDILRETAVARNAVRSTYSHVFLDEFQDCTSGQYQLLRSAFESTPARLTAVGDSKQRIMRYAGALDGIFERFAEDSDPKVLHLYQNFRSAPRIRRVHNQMVKVMEPAAAVPNADLAGDEGIVEILEYSDCAGEAVGLAERIADWVNNDGVAPSDIAVLVRQQAHLYASALTAQLDAQGISYRNEQELQDDFAQPVGRLIVDFLAVVLHARQPNAYRRLMAILTPSSGDEEVDVRSAARWRDVLTHSCALVQSSLDDGTANDTVMAVTSSFLKAVGDDRLTALAPEYAAGNRLRQLIDSVLARVDELIDGVGGSLEDLVQVTDDGAVRVLTIHKAKGLEFDTVVVLGVENETYWGDPEDARATYFVAVSRAKNRLVLTTVEHRTKPNEATGRWDYSRTRHDEFLSYVESVDSV